MTAINSNDNTAFTKTQYGITCNVSGTYRVEFHGAYNQPGVSSSFYLTLNRNSSFPFAFLRLNYSANPNGPVMDCTFEGITTITAGDYIDIMCNNASSNQSFTTCQLFIQQVINDFTNGNTLAGLTDFTSNTTNNYIVSYNSATSKYVSQSANSANLVDKSSGQIISGQKQFSGSTTVAMINSSSPQIPLQVSNGLGNVAIQLTSGATSSYVSQQADDMIITNAVDGLPSVRISQTHTFNQFG